MQSWTLDPIMNPWLLAMIAGVLSALLLLRPRFGKLSQVRRGMLMAARFLVILLALTMMLRPGCITTVEQQQNALLLVMLDATRSMELPHETDEQTRWEKLKAVLEENEDRLAALESQNIEVRVSSFDTQATELEIVQGKITLPEKPGGSETDYGTNIDALTRTARNERLIGLILMGDGVQNALDPRVELTQAAKLLDQSRTPLYAVPLGRPADSGQFADIAVLNMPDNYTGFVKNRQTFTATVAARGFANQTIPVQLLVTDPTGAESVVDTKSITFRGQDQQAVINLGFVPEKPGQYRVAVVAEAQAGEISPRNNRLPAFLTVFDGGLKVLYVTGNANEEQNFIRRAIGSSREIEIRPQILFPNGRDQWPEDLSSEFSDPSYDVIILADVDARALYSKGKMEKNLLAIEQAVAKGKGLMMTGGFHSFGPGLYAETPLENVLPVLMDVTERQDFDQPIRQDLHIDRDIRVRPVGQHFLTTISADGDPGVWKKLPPLKGANRFLKLKGSARKLLVSEANEPILVSTTIGGRVLAFAADTTWLWAMGGYAEEHKRFWRQVVLWLAFRDSLSNSNVWINLAQRRYQPRSLVQFSVGAKNATGQTIDDATFSVQLIRPDGSRTSVSTTVGSEGTHQAQLDRDTVIQPGLYAIEVIAMRNGTELGQSRAEFIVFDQDKEKSVAAANPDQLLRLADQTSEWGGRMVAPDELGRLLDEILTNPPQMKVEIPQKWRLGDTTLDGSIVLILFVVFLATEWALRKKWGLV